MTARSRKQMGPSVVGWLEPMLREKQTGSSMKLGFFTRVVVGIRAHD
jgi:hypothetical protein